MYSTVEKMAFSKGVKRGRRIERYLMLSYFVGLVVVFVMGYWFLNSC